mmetsp:Transcript_43042/g.78661  ORF Transcript_43042/g.78661 Transcript_43042/m.78661 type:complete len:254 (-) Transcript_43042:47-808(-)
MSDKISVARLSGSCRSACKALVSMPLPGAQIPALLRSTTWRPMLRSEVGCWPLPLASAGWAAPSLPLPGFPACLLSAAQGAAGLPFAEPGVDPLPAASPLPGDPLPAEGSCFAIAGFVTTGLAELVSGDISAKLASAAASRASKSSSPSSSSPASSSPARSSSSCIRSSSPSPAVRASRAAASNASTSSSSSPASSAASSASSMSSGSSPAPPSAASSGSTSAPTSALASASASISASASASSSAPASPSGSA